MVDRSGKLEEKFAEIRKEVAQFLPPNVSPPIHLRVPERVRDLQLSYTNPYKADVVSLGLHRTEPERGNRYKVACFRTLIQWYRKHEPSSRDGSHSTLDSGGFGDLWEQFVDGLNLNNDVEAVARRYRIDITYNQMSKVKSFLALDGLFLILFLRFRYNKCPRFRLPEDIYKELHDGAFNSLQAEAPRGSWRDIFLLHNQVPLQILCKVWSSMPDMSLLIEEEALKVFNNLLREVMKERYAKFFPSPTAADGQAYVATVLAEKNFLEGLHLLDCFHYVVCSSSSDYQNSDFHVTIAVEEEAFSPADVIPSAKQLRESGIRLKTKGCYVIEQIKFEESVLAAPALILPRLRIYDQSESISLLLNMAEFEMSTRKEGMARIGPRMSLITPYLHLMTKLAQSEKDIEQMKKDHVLVVVSESNDEICEMFHTIGKVLSFYQHESWSRMILNLIDRYESEGCQIVAEIKREYFGRWWLPLSWVVGFVVLMLTGIQTAVTMAGSYNSNGCSCNVTASP